MAAWISIIHRIVNQHLTTDCKETSEGYFWYWSEDYFHVCKRDDWPGKYPRNHRSISTVWDIRRLYFRSLQIKFCLDDHQEPIIGWSISDPSIDENHYSKRRAKAGCKNIIEIKTKKEAINHCRKHKVPGCCPSNVRWRPRCKASYPHLSAITTSG